MQGIAADNILVVTFTTDAAGEFEQRVKGKIGDFAAGITVSTFHSLAITLLKDNRCAKLGHDTKLWHMSADTPESACKAEVVSVHWLAQCGLAHACAVNERDAAQESGAPVY